MYVMATIGYEYLIEAEPQVTQLCI